MDGPHPSALHSVLMLLSSLYLLLAGAQIAFVSASKLYPRISYAWSITDFQGHMVDLANGKADLFTPIQSFKPTNTTNQHWAIIYSQDAREVYEILNVGSNTIMSHTTALLKKPGPAIHTQIVGSNLTSWWHLNFTKAGARLIDADSGLALTAWPAGPNKQYPSSPLTLEDSDPQNKHQVFNLTCIGGWSFPGTDCD
ncbi:hypothetical protein B0H11DRAFT_2275867 [Mycena galericulata]|nr:hypothetical protein B0H11DRAFT_2275867 [Mycena galericulata]